MSRVWGLGVKGVRVKGDLCACLQYPECQVAYMRGRKVVVTWSRNVVRIFSATDRRLAVPYLVLF